VNFVIKSFRKYRHSELDSESHLTVLTIVSLTNRLY